MADGGVFGDREQFWRDHVASWKSSGMSLRLYSEEHGLKAGTLGYWNSRLKAQAADAGYPLPTATRSKNQANRLDRPSARGDITIRGPESAGPEPMSRH